MIKVIPRSALVRVFSVLFFKHTCTHIHIYIYILSFFLSFSSAMICVASILKLKYLVILICNVLKLLFLFIFQIARLVTIKMKKVRPHASLVHSIHMPLETAIPLAKVRIYR